MDNSETIRTELPKTPETSVDSISPKSNKWPKVVLLALAGLVVAGSLVFAGYKFGQREVPAKTLQPTPTPASTAIPTITPSPTNKTPTSTVTPTPSVELQKRENAQIDWLVDRFESSHKEKRAKEVLALFTPPETEDEKGEYSHWAGLDAAGPRLYSTASTSYQVLAYKIENINQIDPNTYQILLNEKRSNYDNTTGSFEKPEELLFMMVVKRVDQKWYIDKYDFYDLAQQGAIKKYRGFGG